VKGRVTDVLSGGIWVRLQDGRSGFIHRREISWDERVDSDLVVPKLDETIEAVILREDIERQILYLSIRELTDPWKQALAEEKYQVGDTVHGEVVNVRHFAAFVQLEPGIDAVIWPQSIPILGNQAVDEVLWAGDRVVGKITKANPRDRKLEVSILDQIRRSSKSTDRQEELLGLFHFDLAATPNLESANNSEGDLGELVFHPSIPLPKRFLIVDDEKEILEEICQALEREYGVKADGARSGDEAVSLLKKGYDYGLAIIDLGLVGQYGTDVARELWSLKADLPVLYVSSGWADTRGRAKLDIGKAPFARKTPDDIIVWIDRMRRGYWARDGQTDMSEEETSVDNILHQLGMNTIARRPLEVYLEDVTAALQRETEVSHVAVVGLDPVSKNATILSASPSLPDHIVRQASTGLVYSPVRNVIEEKREFLRGGINQYEDRRFKNFFPKLQYRACLIVPVLIPDRPAQHALLLLDRSPIAFSRSHNLGKTRLQQSRVTAQLIAIAIERSVLMDCVRRYQGTYSRGQLLWNMNHEIGNKLQGMRPQVERLKGLLNKMEDSPSSAIGDQTLIKAIDAVHKIDRAEMELEALLNAYKQLAHGRLDTVDINNIAEEAALQLRHRARESSVEIHLDVGDKRLPYTIGIELQLRQVVTNLVLNAIQQIERLYRSLDQLAEEDSLPRFQKNGLVIIQTRYLGPSHELPLRIRVIDTGPGIHRSEQKKIFHMGFSKRGGAGLGLYISRNLIEMMKGRLVLHDSFMFFGSAFVVQLPLHPSIGESKDE
jgi:signal transduction histidine kinase/predicted RNA-binding protein with RPS1 domain/ActR/RegA family two-component response regulator